MVQAHPKVLHSLPAAPSCAHSNTHRGAKSSLHLKTPSPRLALELLSHLFFAVLTSGAAPGRAGVVPVLPFSGVGKAAINK